MNYNSNASSRTSLSRKIKRVSDVNAMGYTPFNPNAQQPVHDMGPSPDNISQYPQMTQQDFGSSPYMNQNLDSRSAPIPSMAYNPNMQYIAPEDGTPRAAPLGAFQQPVVQDFALQYGQQLATVGTSMLQKEVGRYVPVGKLKYYFAVDTKYVVSKLMLLLFPFTHANWSIRYKQDSPVQPRFEINAPDLYIPMMAYITYILVACLLLGTQHRFTFEQMRLLSSSALAWCVVELCCYLGTLYVAMIQTSLRTLDLLAYSGYKFVGMIICLLISLVAGKTGYYTCLVYTNFALAFFLIRALKPQVLPESSPETTSYYGDAKPKSGNKRRLYFLLFVALIQPVLSWWLSYHVMSGDVKKV